MGAYNAARIVLSAAFILSATFAAAPSASAQIVVEADLAGYHTWRLHTVTGELDFCSIEGDNWKCLPVNVWTTGSGGVVR